MRKVKGKNPLNLKTYFLDHFVGDIEMTLTEIKGASPFYTRAISIRSQRLKSEFFS